MNSLDSRFLVVGDCYGHRFAHAGTSLYELSHLPLPRGAHTERDSALAITVRDAPGENSTASQLSVTVSEDEGGLHAEPAQLEIALGDTVLWVADKSIKTGFMREGHEWSTV